MSSVQLRRINPNERQDRQGEIDAVMGTIHRAWGNKVPISDITYDPEKGNVWYRLKEVKDPQCYSWDAFLPYFDDFVSITESHLRDKEKGKGKGKSKKISGRSDRSDRSDRFHNSHHSHSSSASASVSTSALSNLTEQIRQAMQVIFKMKSRQLELQADFQEERAAIQKLGKDGTPDDHANACGIAHPEHTFIGIQEHIQFHVLTLRQIQDELDELTEQIAQAEHILGQMKREFRKHSSASQSSSHHI